MNNAINCVAVWKRGNKYWRVLKLLIVLFTELNNIRITLSAVTKKYYQMNQDINYVTVMLCTNIQIACKYMLSKIIFVSLQKISTSTNCKIYKYCVVLT